MERQVAELEKIVKNQSDELLEMKRKIDILEYIVFRLSICKASNGNFPYYDFIFLMGSRLTNKQGSIDCLCYYPKISRQKIPPPS